MRQIALLTVVIALLTSPLFSQKVSREDALKVGMNFYKHNADKAGMAKSAYNVKDYVAITSDDFDLIHTFNIEDGGYIMVSADMIATPILAYSFEANLNLADMAPATKMWVESYVDQIEEAIKSKSNETSEYLKLWENYFSDNFSKDSETGVIPLITTRWGQETFYNYYCPIVPPNFPGHENGLKCVTGCIATAMAQVMKYYEYPARGNGYGTYYWQEEIVVNYDSYYNWEKMPERLNPSVVQNDSATMLAIAELMFHSGVAVNMSYGPLVSGSQLEYAISNPLNPINGLNPFVQNFGYRGGVDFIVRSFVPTVEWKHTLRTELELERPVLYGGTDKSGDSHAFICDGYQGEDFFHFNWGWEGSNDGYFLVDAVAASATVTTDMLFPVNQVMIIRLAPSGAKGRDYLFCKGQSVYPFIEGSFDDGSGPNNYFEGTNCEWLITLDPIEEEFPELLANFDSLLITFDKFNIAEGDIISIYEGKDDSGKLLGSYSGKNKPPASISTPDKNIFITFITNNDGTVADGWDVSFSTKEKMEVGVPQNNLSKLNIYPNPANDFLRLEGINGSKNSVKIFDIYGKLLVDVSNLKDNSINISNLSDGIYIVRVENEYGNKTMKFVKQ